MSLSIYLDSAATTRCHELVVSSMAPFLTESYGNASSPHRMGRIAAQAVGQARAKLAGALGVEASEIIFTSGATESNNIAILGAFQHADAAPINAVFCPIDHKSVLEVSRELGRRGIDIQYAKVGGEGRVCLSSMEKLINGNTRLVSVSHVNSEIGTIQDIEAIAALCHSSEVILHVDAAQSFGKLRFDLASSRIDCLSISGHKIGGPKGIGALYVSQRVKPRLRPIMFGGNQDGLRSGTLPTPLIVGMGVAGELRGTTDLQQEEAHITRLRDAVLAILTGIGVKFQINSALPVCVPHILNIRFPGVRAESLIRALDGIYIASGSACNATSMEPSYVLKGIGLTDEDANCSIRISLDPRLTMEDVDTAARVLAGKVAQAQALV